jgi:hypothetical protein
MNSHRAALHAHVFDEKGVEYASPDIPQDDLPTLEAFVRHVATASGSSSAAGPSQ